MVWPLSRRKATTIGLGRSQVISSNRLSPYVKVKGSDEPEVGKVFGLAVSGFGHGLEIEAVAFPLGAKGRAASASMRLPGA